MIDVTTLQVVDGFATGSLAHQVTPSWDMTRLYVNNMASDILTEIDAATGQVIGSIPVARPYNLYYTPDGASTIVVAEPYNQLIFFERTSWAHIATLQLPYSGIDHLDFSADGSYLIVSAEFAGWIVKVDLTTISIAGQLAVGGLPIDVKVSPDGSVFYVANQGRHGVSIVDPVTMSEVGFLATGLGAHGLAVSRDGRSLYVSNRNEGTISVIDFASRSVVATWGVGGSPDMLNVSADGTQLWASNRYGNTVSVIDTTSGALTATILVDAAPHGLTFFPQPGSLSLGHNGVYR